MDDISNVVGIEVTSPGNVLAHNEITGGAGLQVQSDDNRILGNRITGQLPMGVQGIGNVVRWNRLGTGIYESVQLGGMANQFVGNSSAFEDGGWDLSVFGEGHVILLNRDGGHATDFNGDCAHNRWALNEFASADPACILEGPLAVLQAQ